MTRCPAPSTATGWEIGPALSTLGAVAVVVALMLVIAVVIQGVGVGRWR